MTPLRTVEPPCECPSAGYCPRYRIRQDDYAWRVCSGNCTSEHPCTEETSRRYRAKWARKAGRPTTVMRTAGNAAPGQPAVTETAPAAATPAKSRGQRFQRPACVHQGEPTGEAVDCPSCSGRVRLKVFACACHGECTVAQLLPLSRQPQVACCRICADYAAPPPEPDRPVPG